LLETPSFRVVKFSAVFFAGNLAEIWVIHCFS
jgi:hypothetical protein